MRPVSGTGNEKDGGYDPFAYYASSGAISFKVFMEILEMETKAYQDQAKMSEITSKLKGDMVVATAQSTEDLYDAKATNINFQMGESITSGLTSGLGMLTTFALPAMVGVKSMQSNLTNVSEFETTAKNLTGGDLVIGDQGEPLVQNESEEILAVRAHFRNGNLSDIASKSINDQIGDTGVSYKDLLTSEFQDQEKKDVIMKNIAVNRKSVEGSLNNVFSNVQMKTTLIQTTTGALRDGGTAGMKSGESAATKMEGLASKDQQIAQSSQQFMSDVGKSQQDQYQQYSGETKDVFRTLGEIIQVDTRG